MDFITQNMGTIAVLLLLAVIVGLIINKMRKDKKSGKGGCGCGCNGCPHANACQTARENKTKEGETYDETV